MPVTYYSESEFRDLKRSYDYNTNELICTIKRLKDERCNMVSGERVMSCGECEYNGWNCTKPKCTSEHQYFCK
jgi:fibrillarin-like rRNA methylase